MPAFNPGDLLSSPEALGFLKGVILLILIFYAIFALIVVRQVNLMSKTLITPVSPIVRAISIAHAGFAIGFIFLVFGVL